MIPLSRIELILFPLVLYFSTDFLIGHTWVYDNFGFWPSNGQIKIFNPFSTNQNFHIDQKEFSLQFSHDINQRKNTSPFAFLKFCYFQPYLFSICLHYMISRPYYKPYIFWKLNIWWWQRPRNRPIKRQIQWQRHTDKDKYKVLLRPNVCYFFSSKAWGPRI